MTDTPSSSDDTDRSPDSARGTGLPSPAAPHRHRGRRVVLFIISFVLGLGVVLTAAGVGFAAWDSGYRERILPGVHVGSTDLAGLDRAAAAAALAAAYPYDRGTLVLRTPGGDITIPYSAFGRRADVDALAEAALASGRGGDLAARFAAQVGQAMHGVNFSPRVILDPAALTASVEHALEPLNTAPVDATIAIDGDGYAMAPARDGASVDPAPVAAAAIAALREVDAPAELVLTVTTTPVPPAVSDTAVHLAADRATRMTGDVTVKFGKSTWVIKAATVRSWLGFAAPVDGEIAPTVDAAKIPASLKAVAKKVKRPAKSAVFLKSKSGKVMGVAASADGRQLDSEATAQLIADELAARASTGASATVSIATAPVPPKLTTEQAKQHAPVLTLLGTWTTWFPINDHNFYGANIWIPARIINGTVLAPGHTFDWWATIGEVSPARGFGPGGVIKGDHTEPTGALGGGMCSSSTTLFNAALRAGLQMGARSNHRYYINRYPLGLDATVSKMGRGVQNMTFTNDTGHAILILGVKTRSGGRGYVTYQLWGIPDGRRVSLSRPSVTNVVKATTKVEYVSTLPHGRKVQVEYPSNQMDIAITRVVRDKSGRVIHSEVWRTHYVLWNGLVQIGR